MHHTQYVALASTTFSLSAAFPRYEQSLYGRTEVDPVDLTAVVYPDYADPPASEGAWVGCDFGTSPKSLAYSPHLIKA